MPKRVLIIDDDRNTVRFLSVALEENGYEAVGANDGEEGFGKLEEVKPDLLILDVMMPKRTGFTLFKRIKKVEALRNIPVIMLTGIASVMSEMEGEEDVDHGIYDPLRETVMAAIRELRDEGLVRPEMFVDKPIDPEALVQKVRELIGD